MNFSLQPQPYIDIPDPEAVLAIVKVLNGAYKLNIKTDILEVSVKKLHEQTNEIINKFNQMQKDKTQKQAEQSIYG